MPATSHSTEDTKDGSRVGNRERAKGGGYLLIEKERKKIVLVGVHASTAAIAALVAAMQWATIHNGHQAFLILSIYLLTL